jgi:hypothetical protein
MPYATARPAPAACCPDHAEPAVPASGSRRRRLWELVPHAHCPVVGVCLPMPLLRRLAGKVLGGEVLGDDYHLHSGAIAECKQRTPLAEAIQRELDRRYAIALRHVAACKTGAALEVAWKQALAGDDVAGMFWAVLSHARCDAVLEEEVLHDIHMLQHQLGASDRADRRRLHELEALHRTLVQELAETRQRAAAQAIEQARRVEQLQAELLRARADLIGRDTAIASLWERLSALEAAAPGLASRFELAREHERQAERIQDLERLLNRLRQEADAARRAPVETLPAAPPVAAEPPAPAALAESIAALADRAVLCVGGRAANVPAYRRLIERTGGRFLHHDGGEHDNVTALDSTLAAADLVICQTGCISHDAYWRVKDHCKRFGKRCVFVENPSRSGLQRALLSLVPVVAEPVARPSPA